MIVWVPNTQVFPGYGRVAVIKHPDENRVYRRQGFTRSDGACFTFWRERDTAEQQRMLLVIAWQMVVRDGVKAQDVHTALSVIPEYRDMLAEDMPKPD